MERDLSRQREEMVCIGLHFRMKFSLKKFRLTIIDLEATFGF